VPVNNYDRDYYFIHWPLSDNKDIPSLQADSTTSMRSYDYEVQPTGDAPLVFKNSWRDRNRQRGIQEFIGDVLFEGFNVLVRERVRLALLAHDIPGLQMNSAVYIDDKDRWHEDFWFLTFCQRFDCWDRKASTYIDEPLEGGGMKVYPVEKFHLDAAILDKVPLEKRLLFKMGGSIDGLVTVHETLLPIFRKGRSGAEFFRVADF
jgi:hypothetical protein